MSDEAVPDGLAQTKKRRQDWQASKLAGSFFGTSWRQLTEGNHRKSATRALYQSAANLFVLVVVAVAFALYYVFSAFLRPLLWAVLCGTFLFPVKRRATRGLLKWLRLLQANSTPLCVGMWLLPLQMATYLLTKLERMIRRQWRHIGLVGTLFTGAYCVNNFPVFAALEATLDGFITTCLGALVRIRQLGFYVRP